MLDFKDEIVRQMNITEKITNQVKGNRKSYLEVEAGKVVFFFLTYKERYSYFEQYDIVPYNSLALINKLLAFSCFRCI